MRFPKGSVIRVEAEYDNSTDNPYNPNSPPQPVHWGEQTTDEMCLLSVQLTTDSMADLRAITRLATARLGGATAGGVDGSDLDGLGGERVRRQKFGRDNDPRVVAIVELVLRTALRFPPRPASG